MMRLGALDLLLLVVAASLFGCAKSREGSAERSSNDPQAAIPDRPLVALHTSMGTIKIELMPKKAPATVENFIRYVRSGHYNGTIFHRVIDGFMIQGGGFDENLQERPTTEPIRNEAHNGLSNRRATIAMARTPDPHSGSAQFFINVADNPNLDHREQTPSGWGYCVFGKVTEGMDVVDRIKAVQTASKGRFQNVPVSNVTINEIKLLN